MSTTYRYRNNDGLVRWTVSLLYIYAAICAAAAVSGYLELDFLTRVKTQVFMSDEALLDEATAIDDRQMVVAILGLASFIVTGVTSLVWVYRANVNARAMGADLETSPGWAVGWFFVPFAALVMPFLAMRDLWKGSASPGSWREQSVPNLLMGAWWTFLIVGSVLAVAGLRIDLSTEELDGYILSSQLTIASTVSDIVAAPLFATIIRGIHRMQRPLADHS